MNRRRLVACFALSALSSFAQTARIAGRVIDRSGAVVPGTFVTVTKTQTGAERKVVTGKLPRTFSQARSKWPSSRIG